MATAISTKALKTKNAGGTRVYNLFGSLRMTGLQVFVSTAVAVTLLTYTVLATGIWLHPYVWWQTKMVDRHYESESTYELVLDNGWIDSLSVMDAPRN